MKSIYTLKHGKLTMFFPLLIVCSLFCNSIVAQPGALDLSFGVNGKVLTNIPPVQFKASTVAIQPNGKLVVAGYTNKLSTGVFAVARYNANGTLDSSFATNGIFKYNLYTNNDQAKSIAIQPDGKIVVAGYAELPTGISDKDFVLLRLLPNGILDNSFGNNGVVTKDFFSNSDDELFKIAIRPTGQIIAAGYIEHGITSNKGITVIQYTSAGVIDSSFGTSGIAQSYALGSNAGGSMLLQPDGKVVVVSSPDNPTFFGGFGAMRFTANGMIDSTFGNNGYSYTAVGTGLSFVYDVTLQFDGKYLLVGESTNVSSYQIAIIRLNSAGILDSSFGTGGKVETQIGNNNDAGATVHAQPDGKIIVSANTNYGLVSADFALLRYNSNGWPDSTFGIHGIVTTDFGNDDDEVSGSLIQPDGKIVLVGEGSDSSSNEGFVIARYENTFATYYNTVYAYAFLDINNNGIQDSTEVFYPNPAITAIKGIDTLLFSSLQSSALIITDTGSYNIQVVGMPYYYMSVPMSHTISHNSYFNTDTIAFAIRYSFSLKNGFVNLIPLSSAVAGGTTQYELVYRNYGTDSLSTGNIDMIKDSRLSFNTADVTPVLVNTDTIRWTFNNLRPLETRIIKATLSVPGTMVVGDTIGTRVKLQTAADVLPNDNDARFTQKIANNNISNEVSEAHGGFVSTAEIADGQYLYYTIRFKNTGTKTAFNVFLRNKLSLKLRKNTLETISSSHPFNMSQNGNGELVWTLYNANLAPSQSGYVTYRIKPMLNLIPGDTILNTALISMNTNLRLNTPVDKVTVISALFPLTMLGFTAEKQFNGNLLIWSTAQEINTAKFEVERSENGRDFKTVGTVRSKGNTFQNKYDFVDFEGRNLTAGKLIFYRLKMVDLDNRYQYSSIRSIRNDISTDITVYPNPASDYLQIQVNNAHTEDISLEVFDNNGRTLITQNSQMQRGNDLKKLNIQKLIPGIYYLKITKANGEAQTVQFEKK